VGGKKKVDRAQVGESVAPSKKKGPPPPAQVEAQRYVIDYTLEAAQLRFVPQQNADLLNSLAIMVTLFGQDGRMLGGVSTQAKSTLPPEVYAKVIKGDIGFQEEVDIPVDATSVRLGVQDQVANRLGTLDIPLPLPPTPESSRRAREPLPEIEPD
jgi:hypothetical protein